MNMLPIIRAIYRRYQDEIIAIAKGIMIFVGGVIMLGIGLLIFKFMRGANTESISGFLIIAFVAIIVVIALTLVVAAFVYNRLLPKKEKSGTRKETTKADEKSSKSEKKSGKGLSKAVWILLAVFVGLPMIGALFILSGWLYGAYYQSQEKVWVNETRAKPAHMEGIPTRDSTTQTCYDVQDTPARFEMACVNAKGKEIFYWEKSLPEGKWWREGDKKVEGTFTIIKESSTSYIGEGDAGMGRKFLFHLSLQDK